MIDLTEKLIGVRRTVAARVTPDNDPKLARIFKWTFVFDEVTIDDLIDLSIRPRRITKANSVRYDEKFVELPEEETIFVKPLSVREVKVLTAGDLLAKAEKLSDVEKQKLIDKILAM